MLWVGSISGFAGSIAYNYIAFDEMLPFNRILLSIIVTLVVAWALLKLANKVRDLR